MSFYNDKSMNFTYRTIFMTYKRIIFAYKYECYQNIVIFASYVNI